MCVSLLVRGGGVVWYSINQKVANPPPPKKRIFTRKKFQFARKPHKKLTF
jgi:hypothetical protein